MSTDETADPIERDVDVAWELYEAQPTHPEVGRLAARILAQRPERTGIRMLLAMHRRQCGEVDEAREMLLGIIGQRDRYFIDAARELRELEDYECNYAEARRWAEAVVREDQESALDIIELGLATAMSGDLEAGWQLMDDGVALCARTDPDSLSNALTRRSIYLMQSWAPAERFIPGAEEAIKADPSSSFIGGPLAWAYMREGRFEDAEELTRRMLRLDPTDGMAAGVLNVLRDWQAVIDKGEVSLADIHESGVVEWAWTQKRDELLGTGLDSALAALDDVMPAELKAALRPPLDEEAASASPGEPKIAAWHDGQEPGTGSLWGIDGDFRLMSSAEITAMDEAIEANPEAHPGWEQDGLDDYYAQLMTDDNGSYLIATLEHVAMRRSGADDVVVAPSLAGWFWDRVAAFGGRDPRPRASSEDRADARAAGSEPVLGEGEPRAQGEVPPARQDTSAEMTATIDRLSDAIKAAPAGDTTAQIALWQQVARLEHWFFIARGSSDQPRPYAVGFAQGPMVCLYSSAVRATEAGGLFGLADTEGGAVPLLGMPMPAAIDYVASLGQFGVAGVTLDHPQIGHSIPLSNLGLLKDWIEESGRAVTACHRVSGVVFAAAPHRLAAPDEVRGDGYRRGE